MGLKVLSLFDGMSCGQLAFNELKKEIDVYFASEIDKYAIQTTQNNFPNTIQIGDVTKVKHISSIGEAFGDCKNEIIIKGSGFSILNTNIDVLIGGSPCQGFSLAGDGLAFDDPRSKLFFEYVRILKEVKPKYFLLENVKMKKEFQDIISENLFGIKPIEINSALLTAQNRKRLYWVGELQENGTYKQVNIKQPQDKGVLLKDILENEVDASFYLKNDQIEKILEKIKDLNSDISSIIDVYNKKLKKDNKCPTLTDPCHNNIRLLERPHGYNKGSIYENKSPTIRCQVNGNTLHINYPIIRKLTPIECERLQGVKDNYTFGVSNSQRYKMLGNGWTIPVISHILSHFNF